MYTFGIASLLARQLQEKNKATVFITSYLPILNSFQVIEFNRFVLFIFLILQICPVFLVLYVAEIRAFSSQSFRG